MLVILPVQSFPFALFFTSFPSKTVTTTMGTFRFEAKNHKEKRTTATCKNMTVFFRFSSFLSIFVAMKIKFDWKRILIFTIISAGLLYITSSALMSAGILLLLFVVYYLLVGCIETYQQKKQRGKEKDTHS
jgi:hypothetical protein